MAEHFGINIKVENKEIADYLRNAKTVTFGLVENLVGKVSKNSRIDSLSANLGLEDRRFNGDNLLDILNEMDYASIDKKVEEMRAKSKQFLDTALAFCEE